MTPPHDKKTFLEREKWFKWGIHHTRSLFCYPLIIILSMGLHTSKNVHMRGNSLPTKRQNSNSESGSTKRPKNFSNNLMEV